MRRRRKAGWQAPVREEPAGDYLRSAACLVEGFAEGDLLKRALIAAPAVDGHAPGYCPFLPVALHLAQALAVTATAMEIDLAGAMAAWREAAAQLEAAG